MSVYTRIEAPTMIETCISPGLLFHKWQPWDDFSDWKREKCSIAYYQNVAQKVDASLSSAEYTGWFRRYTDACTAGSGFSIEHDTLWRMLVGWGTNPSLETGVSLHHLFGCPVIPGSAVKGLLHHVAELQSVNQYETFRANNTLTFEGVVPDYLTAFVADLEKIRELFGSIHLDRNSDDHGTDGPVTILSRLILSAKNVASLPIAWKSIIEKMQFLIQSSTGSILCCYDALPVPGQSGMMQPDIVNVHYPNYYGSEDGTYPSDDQNPKPVTFLAVAPEKKFRFFFKLRKMAPDSEPYWDEDQQRRAELGFVQSIAAKVQQSMEELLKLSLGEYGVGAKTAAGYGYFNTIPFNPADWSNNDKTSDSHSTSEKTITGSQPKIESVEAKKPDAVEPPAGNVGKKLHKIGGSYGLAKWQAIAKSGYIAAVTGEKAIAKEFDNVPFPGHTMNTRKGLATDLYYRLGNLYCKVRIVFEAIQTKEEAQWVLENVIYPEIPEAKPTPGTIE